MRLLTSLENALRAHLAGAKPRVPEAGRDLWAIFGQLSAARTYGYGPNPIRYAEIEAYCRLHRWPLDSRHVEIIRALDQIWLEAAQQRTEARRDGKKPVPQRSSQPFTMAVFDAVFG